MPYSDPEITIQCVQTYHTETEDLCFVQKRSAYSLGPASVSFSSCQVSADEICQRSINFICSSVCRMTHQWLAVSLSALSDTSSMTEVVTGRIWYDWVKPTVHLDSWGQFGRAGRYHPCKGPATTHKSW